MIVNDAPNVLACGQCNWQCLSAETNGQKSITEASVRTYHQRLLPRCVPLESRLLPFSAPTIAATLSSPGTHQLAHLTPLWCTQQTQQPAGDYLLQAQPSNPDLSRSLLLGANEKQSINGFRQLAT